MQAAAFVPLGFFLVTALVVAFRLLGLWRRTRRLPEFAIGAGVVLTAVVGMPLSVAGRLPATVATTFGNLVFALGLISVCAGITLFFSFTASVFHARSRAARGFILAVALTMATLALGLIRAASFGSDIVEIIAHTRIWAIGVVGMLIAAFAWTAFESLRYYRQLRRRRLLGLGDPVSENRFLLWGVGGVAMVAMAGSIAAFLAAGRAVLVEPAALSVMAACGLVMGATWLLTFVPPERYLRRIAEAHPAAAAGAD